MTAGWVAGGVRGRLLTRRRLGAVGARQVAASEGSEAAVALLARSPYGREVREGLSAAEARRGIGRVCLWHLRVLAGWVPARGGALVRVFAARFELVNIADRLAAFAGAPGPAPYPLGSLAVAWPRVAVAVTAEELRAVLSASVWGDPGVASWPEAAAALEVRWASWLAEAAPDAGEWAAGAAALVAARLLVAGQRAPAAAATDLQRLLGHGWEAATDIADLTARLPRAAVWSLADLDGSGDLWRGEGRWWRRVDRDAAATLRAARPGAAAVAAASARLVADAWRTQAALEAAAWGPRGLELFDAVA